MNVNNSLSFLFSNLSNIFRTNLESLMNEIELHSGQVFVLISLWQEDGQNQVSLAQNLNLSTPTINKMIKSLADNKFVSCRQCNLDRRMMRVYLTDKGRKYEDLVYEQWGKMEAEAFANLTETEKLVLSQLLIKLKENFVKKTKAGQKILLN